MENNFKILNSKLKLYFEKPNKSIFAHFKQKYHIALYNIDTHRWKSYLIKESKYILIEFLIMQMLINYLKINPTIIINNLNIYDAVVGNDEFNENYFDVVIYTK